MSFCSKEHPLSHPLYTFTNWLWAYLLPYCVRSTRVLRSKCTCTPFAIRSYFERNTITIKPYGQNNRLIYKERMPMFKVTENLNYNKLKTFPIRPKCKKKC